MEQFYPIIVALIFNLLDLCTGIITAVKLKDIQSSKLRDGLFKKVGFMLCYFIAWLVDTQGSIIGFQFSTPVLPVIVLYSCTTELVSILEKMCKINHAIPPERVMEFFHIYDDKKEN